jgi:nucleoside-diphosphate-sugar epimerase
MNSAARSVVIRVFNTYGPAMDFPAPKRVIPHFIDRVLKGQSLRLSGNGSQRRCFCYAEDMIRGMVLALVHTASQSAPFSECFNLGSSDPITIRELAHKIVGIAGDLEMLAKPCAVRPHAFRYSQNFDDSWSRVPDITRAKKILGFHPKVSLSDGLKSTLIYYRNLINASALTLTTLSQGARETLAWPIESAA